jgi:FAD/FMN-containing dehydrogenase
MNTHTPSATAFPADELRHRLGGELYEPGDPAYEDTCTLFNSMVEHRPRYVARCIAVDDVVASLAFAREHGLGISVRSGGHSVTGLSLADGGLVIDMRGINEIEVDAERRVAVVGGGALWGDLDEATQRYGLATTGGRVSSTGVGGLTLGGGSGWLERKHGLACDNLRAVQLVTADGRIVEADAERNPDLFWAVRGGGGNFGVVTRLEFDLHPVGPEVLGGLLMHPAERGAELLKLWRDVMTDAPEELSLACAYMVAPDEEEIPAQLRGKSVVVIAGMYAGEIEEGERVLAPIREFGPPAVDFFGPTGYAEFQRSIDDPPGYRNYWTAEQMDELSDEAIAAIHARAQQMPGSAPQIFCVAWGGAIGRRGSESSPLAGRHSRFVIHPLLLWDDPADDEAALAWGRGFREEIRAFANGGAYANFTGEEGTERTVAAYGAENYERLRRIKAAWDPQDVFHAPGHVAPATA